jgi:ATP-binding cassette, subfamily B, bacterial
MSLVTSEPEKNGDDSPMTIFDLQPDPEAKVNLRRLPSIVRAGLGIVASSSRLELVIVIVLQLVGAASLVLLLLLGQRALQAVASIDRTGGTVGDVVPWALALAGVASAQLFAGALLRERQQILGELVNRHVEEQVLDVSAAVELEAFETPAFHNRIQRARMQRHQPLNLVYGLTGLANAAFGIGAIVVALAAIEPLLIPLVAAVLGPAWLAASRRGEAFYRFFWRWTPRDRERNYVAGLLSDRDAAKEVRAFGLAPHLRTRYRALYDERLAELKKVVRKQLAYTFAANLVIGAVLAGTLLLISWLTLTDRISATEAAVTIAGIALASGRLTQAGFAAGALAEASLYVDDYREFLALLPEAERRRPTAPAPAGFRRLAVDGVSFTYPTGNEPALVDVSLEVDAGEIVALVGENGSGKTTLAKLLARLYTPDSGTIRWDGNDIAQLDPDQLRRGVAVIFQDFLRFHLPARDNIGLGRHDVMDDLERIVDAAVQADADAFVRELRSGYETMLGPEFMGGTDLSVGQWQRLALARAFFRDAPFIVLDEPTASLDARAEHELFERLRTLLIGRTVLLISHRFSSVRSADRIYVLHEGRIVESGTHETLMRTSGRYAELFTLQAAAYRDGTTLDGARRRQRGSATVKRTVEESP